MADALLSLTGDTVLTEALARAIAGELAAGDTLLLDGPVGAGKSHFSRALIRARLENPAEDVPSPTFTLVQTYESDPPVWHADLYRLTDPAEVDELGLTDALPDAIALIEWPDRMDPVLGALSLRLRPQADPDLRQITLIGDAARWSHIRRAAERAAFVWRAGWGDADAGFLAGDASARRYFRLSRGDQTAVLMDADAATLAPYLAMTDWLRERGFDAPAVLAVDREAGLALIEDFGDAQIARVIEADPDKAGPLYDRIAAMLARLASFPSAPGIAVLDGPAMAEQVGLFAQWYPAAAGAVPDAQAAADQIAPTIARLHEVLCVDAAPVTCLRDFHAENLILTGDGRLGLLDFQDAVATHPAYDLVSALHDARRALPAEVEASAIARFLDDTGMDPARFHAAFALLGAQRNLRIMGIFTRLCLRDAKPRYLAFMPHVWLLILRETSHPALADLAALIARLPAPTPDIIERIRARCPR
ncbi:MAG: tRNA (adenosine(37)-N6)-threonylcarbamoyltransferase complex ATPase subunit type 1 TsaE [Paracoccus sp. (in: a-proteobacteria)]